MNLRPRLFASAASLTAAGLSVGMPGPAAAQTAVSVQLETITVTARHQSENVQSVPDAITALSSSDIVNAHINDLSDLSQVVPDLNFRSGSGYEGNFFDLRMRGIGQAQGGWPAVGFLIDGVPAGSSDALTSMSLMDVERIEVLRGPQSALYGANAIAGAINVITKRPTEHTEAEGRLYYGNGNNALAAASVSGQIAPNLLGRIFTQFVNDDGRINSATNSIHLDPTSSKHVEGRLIYDPVDSFEADLRASYDFQRVGFALQDRLPSVAYLNDYSPLYDPRRDYPGRQDREFWNVALRLKYDTEFVTLSSVSSFAHAQQAGKGSGCYDDVNDPGIFQNSNGSVTCLSSIMAYGNRAVPGQAIEAFQAASDDYRTFFQDVRLASNGAGPFKWLLGVDGMGRNTLDGQFNTYTQQQAAGVGTVTISSRADARGDRWMGAYGQVGYTLGAWELTANGRYDSQSYRNTTYKDTSRTVIVQVTSPTGALVGTQRVKVTDFQPKGQLSYHFNEDKMAYLTYSEGFRAGYFNTGAYGNPEYTTNYEGGIKTEWLERRLQANLSVFHINYSNQQLSTTILNPPYRLPVTVPKTHIDGAEFESAYLLFEGFTLSGNLSYLNATVVGSSATVTDGTASPKAPHWSGLVATQYTVPLAGGWSLNTHLDVAFHSSEYLFLNDTQQIPANAFLNARIGFENDNFGVYFVGQNLSDKQEGGTNAGINAVYYARYRIEPRSYGLELRAKL